VFDCDLSVEILQCFYFFGIWVFFLILIIKFYFSISSFYVVVIGNCSWWFVSYWFLLGFCGLKKVLVLSWLILLNRFQFGCLQKKKTKYERTKNKIKVTWQSFILKEDSLALCLFLLVWSLNSFFLNYPLLNNHLNPKA
jgi:hypothetical protein